ncbi:ABC transporter substrate-binding protein [Methylobacterium oryzihabitans]|uniref:ABC transporter substrate-binding protein n=1 Tax=Methylobacterium oryzihabitans TaxID=2499852 RepID=A0A3S2YTI4_9HYPH|nr:ABC transporter substrate-binding protein [Methylobacterium oryzihabitans]RVU18820.1 ABC transporter substrate-binding protein [Methylobacterium oryzihabitans]
MKRMVLALAMAGAALSFPALAAEPVKIGVTIAKTGPAASLGIPQANSVPLFPTEVAGHKIEWIVLDDATDSTKGVANARKLASDDKVDAILGSSTTPVSLAMIEVAAEAKVPMITVAASSKLISPMDDKRRWVFKTAQNDSLMADAIVEHMVKAGIKSVGFIGFNDAYGDGWLTEITPRLEAKGIKLVATERFARTDTSVTGQTLKLTAAQPDAVLIAGSGTPAALPQKTLKSRGYAGKIYQTHGVANADFLRVGAKDVEGTILPAGPLLVAEQLPESNPVRKVALDYTRAYEAKNGAGSLATFGGHAYDAAILLATALPVALKSGAEPGTPAFRAALRDALEGLKEVVYTHGVATMSPTDHIGQDQRARVMVTIEGGKWKLLSATN